MYPVGDTIATNLLKAIRQVSLIPYLIIFAIFCAVVTAGMCLWDQFLDEWNHNI